MNPDVLGQGGRFPYSTDSYLHPLVFVFVKLSVVFHDKYQSYKYEKYSREICYLAGRVETNTLEQIFQLWGRDRKITIQFNFALIGFISQMANLKAWI